MLTLFSPAKINLFLRVLKKRSDGYHELASMIQAIDLGDWMTFDFATHDRLTCSDPNLLCDHTNLISRALALFRRQSGLNVHLQVHLDKKIPQQAGLGGGSSNAATTLWALNWLHGSPYAVEELQTWSSELGSDIPFFFSEGSAFCTGRGERVQNLLPPPAPSSIGFFKPPEGISTPVIYKALQLETCSPISPEQLLEELYSDDPFFHNDLQIPAFSHCPKLKNYHDRLSQEGMRHITLSGSGTTLFGYSQTHSPIKFLNRAPTSWYLPA